MSDLLRVPVTHIGMLKRRRREEPVVPRTVFKTYFLLEFYSNYRKLDS